MTLDVVLSALIGAPVVVVVAGWVVAQMVGEWRLRRLYRQPTTITHPLRATLPAGTSIPPPRSLVIDATARAELPR